MGAKLGRYELGPEIGRGNMAVVHRAFDTRLQRQLALKILHPEYARDVRRRREFLTEAHAAGRLSHPGVMTIHDVGESGGRPFMAMELLEGRTLQKKLEEDGPLPVRDVLDIGIQLADALDYAHRQGVIHRDVKADNIVMTGQGNRVKLTDFGIARLRQSRPTGPETDPSIVGTPNYMAPEQIRGDRIDQRADLYALGVLLYRLLSGRLPFARKRTRDTLKAILTERPAPLRPRDRNTPSTLIAVIRTLMARSPADRYGTGAELADDLREILKDLEAEASTRVRIPLSVRWPAILGLAVAVTLLVGTAAVHYHQRSVMSGLMFEFGNSMADMVASETAEDLLLGDEIALQALVEDMQANEQMAYLRVMDRDGRVIASSIPSERDRVAAELFQGETLRETEAGQRIARYREGDAERFLFQSPIRYREREIGSLALGISTTPLESALGTGLIAMGLLAATTLMAVLLGAYVLARRLRLPVRVLARAMDRLAAGHRGHRIRLQRRDEFGELFTRYNLMAESLEATEAVRDKSRKKSSNDGEQSPADTTQRMRRPR